jgi:hypothetical protein
MRPSGGIKALTFFWDPGDPGCPDPPTPDQVPGSGGRQQLSASSKLARKALLSSGSLVCLVTSDVFGSSPYAGTYVAFFYILMVLGVVPAWALVCLYLGVLQPSPQENI